MSSKMRRVAIIHPWMPHYRAPVLTALTKELADRGIGLDVFYGETPPEWSDRNDAVSPDSMVCLPTSFIPIGNRSLAYKSVGPLVDRGRYDLIIFEQAIRNLETYRIIADRRLYSRIAFWGHGKTYTVKKSKLAEWLKAMLTKRGDWFFGYTPGGVHEVVRRGFPSTRTTVVQNATDTTALRSEMDGISEFDLCRFAQEHSLSGRTALYIGGIDEAKRIPFLLDAAEQVYRSLPEFKLIVAGSGSMASIVKDRSETAEWLLYLGPLFGRAKALAMKSVQLLMVPGRVGLVAVDSLAAGKPLVTTSWPFHAPEFEYLKAGTTCVVSENSVQDYASKVIEYLSDRERLLEISRNCLKDSEKYTSHAMATNFADGIAAALSDLPI